MTAFSRRVLGSTLAAFVSMPAVATAVGFGPMSYHSGAALLVRVLAVLAASGALAMVFAIAGYVYWLHVIAPAPSPAMPSLRRVALSHDADLRRRQSRDGGRRLAADLR